MSVRVVTEVPKSLDGANVLLYTSIDERHRHTGNCNQIVDGVLQGSAKGLAICKYDGDESVYLFGCDGDWKTVTDTLHESVEEAKKQAEFEYEGVSATWETVMIVLNIVCPIAVA